MKVTAHGGSSGAEVRLVVVPLLLLHLLFTIGLAFVLSAVTTGFRDVAHFTEVALQAGIDAGDYHGIDAERLQRIG